MILWVNKVGPFRNPQETYEFYSLPYCHPDEVVDAGFEGLGEALQGYELRKSPMLVHFKSKSCIMLVVVFCVDSGYLQRMLKEKQFALRNLVLKKLINFHTQLQTSTGINCFWMTFPFGVSCLFVIAKCIN